MKNNDFQPQKLFLAPSKNVKLAKIPTEFELKAVDKELGAELLQEEKKKMFDFQEVLMAEKKQSLWIIIQAMDAAGKDSTIEHVFSGLNPQAVQVHAFKAPTADEYAHDFLWRHANAVPEKGKIGIHNRSHYEFLTTCKVHPNFNLAENLSQIQSVEDVNADFWKHRFQSVEHLESHLAQNGVHILKIYLHISLEEQKSRFLDRIDQPDKNWKFNANDLKERALWDDYMAAFEEVFEKTSKKHAPWYIIPADKKWFARLAIAKIVNHHLKQMDMQFPVMPEEEKALLESSKNQLLQEK